MAILIPRPCRVHGHICSGCIIDFVSVLAMVFRLVVWVVGVVCVQNLAVLLDNLSLMDPGQHFLQKG